MSLIFFFQQSSHSSAAKGALICVKRCFFRLVQRPNEKRHCDCHEDGDDGHDDQKFRKKKASSSFHRSVALPARQEMFCLAKGG